MPEATNVDFTMCFRRREEPNVVFHRFSEENERSETIWESWAEEAKFLENGRVSKTL